MSPTGIATSWDFLRDVDALDERGFTAYTTMLLGTVASENDVECERGAARAQATIFPANVVGASWTATTGYFTTDVPGVQSQIQAGDGLAAGAAIMVQTTDDEGAPSTAGITVWRNNDDAWIRQEAGVDYLIQAREPGEWLVWLPTALPPATRLRFSGPAGDPTGE